MSADTPGSHFPVQHADDESRGAFRGNTCHASHRGSSRGAARPEPGPVRDSECQVFKKFSSFKLHSATRIEWLCTDTLPCWIKLLVLLKLPDCRMSPPCFLRFLRSFACCRAHFRKASLRFCSLRSSFIIFRPSCADTRIYAVLLSALALFIKQRFLQFYSIPHFAFTYYVQTVKYLQNKAVLSFKLHNYLRAAIAWSAPEW